MHYYPQIDIPEQVVMPELFFINDSVYAQGFICNERIKKLLADAGLTGFNLVPLEEFATEQQFRDAHPYPTAELARSRNRY